MLKSIQRVNGRSERVKVTEIYCWEITFVSRCVTLLYFHLCIFFLQLCAFENRSESGESRICVFRDRYINACSCPMLNVGSFRNLLGNLLRCLSSIVPTAFICLQVLKKISPKISFRSSLMTMLQCDFHANTFANDVHPVDVCTYCRPAGSWTRCIIHIFENCINVRAGASCRCSAR